MSGLLKIILEAIAKVIAPRPKAPVKEPLKFHYGIYRPYGMITQYDFAVFVATLYGECRNEPHEGKIAVAYTILNRVVANKWWGHSVNAVCLFPKQFSLWNDWDKKTEYKQWENRDKAVKVRALVKDHRYRELDKAAQDCVQAALEALGGYPDPSHGATHYYAPRGVKTAPRWTIGQEPTAKIGNHIFYKLEA